MQEKLKNMLITNIPNFRVLSLALSTSGILIASIDTYMVKHIGRRLVADLRGKVVYTQLKEVEKSTPIRMRFKLNPEGLVEDGELKFKTTHLKVYA